MAEKPEALRCRIITLDPSLDRAQHLQQSLVQCGIEAVFFQAVDGRSQMPELETGEQLDHAALRRYRTSPLGSAELGAYLSHFRAIKQAWNDGAEKLCLFEDDVHLETDFAAVLSELVDLPDGYEFIRFMALKRQKRKTALALSQRRAADDRHYLVTRPLRGTIGGQGLLINRAGMRKLLDVGCKISMPIDKLYDHYWETNVHCFVVEPHIVWESAKPTTIAKPDFGKGQLLLPQRLLRVLVKLRRSLKRRGYLLLNYQKFYPVTKPPQDLGRSPRLR